MHKLNVTIAQIELAFEACRAIVFATKQACRHGGDYSLSDLLAADRLANEALKLQRRIKLKSDAKRKAERRV